MLLRENEAKEQTWAIWISKVFSTESMVDCLNNPIHTQYSQSKVCPSHWYCVKCVISIPSFVFIRTFYIWSIWKWAQLVKKNLAVIDKMKGGASPWYLSMQTYKTIKFCSRWICDDNHQISPTCCKTLIHVKPFSPSLPVGEKKKKHHDGPHRPGLQLQ